MLTFQFEDFKDKNSSDEEAAHSEEVITSFDGMSISSPETEEVTSKTASVFLFTHECLKALNTRQSPEEYLESIKKIVSAMEQKQNFAPVEYSELRDRLEKKEKEAKDQPSTNGQSITNAIDCVTEIKCWESILLARVQLKQRSDLNQSNDSPNRRRQGYRSINVFGK